MPLNGAYEKINNIEADVKIIKDDLSESVRGLALSIDSLTNKIDSFITVAQNSIPIKAVFWLLAIMVMGLIGIEGVKSIGPLMKYFLPL